MTHTSRASRWIVVLAVAALLAPLAGSAAATPLQQEQDPIVERLETLEANEEGLSESQRLQEFIDLYFEYSMREFPEFATYIGYPGDHGRWTDNSLQAIERREADALRALDVLRSFDRQELEGDDRLNYDLLLTELEEMAQGTRFPGEYLAINQMGGVQQDVPRLLTMMPTRTVAQVEDVLSRLRGVPGVIENTIALLEAGLEGGVTPPKITLRDVPQQVEDMLAEDPMESPLLRGLAELGEGIPEAERQRLRQEAASIYTDEVAPAFRRLHEYLVGAYIPGAREEIGMSALPDGEAWYAFRARQMTTSDLTPQEIHDIGLSEVARIREEMDRVIVESGFEGGFAEFTDFLRTDPRFYYDDAEELLRDYRDIGKRVDPQLTRLFGRLPRLPYGVKPVPAYAERSQTTAYYEPGSADAGRPGWFVANTYDLESRPKWEMEALTLHESVPGHHLQISLAQEIEDLPWFRRFGGETAFVEGWGLYAESLGEEIGLYQDPYSEFGQLTYEMWRAVRLVVDTGMHALGWSRQRAIDYFIENTGKAEHDIVVEVDRYIVWPGQALAYKIGELKFQELREYAEEGLGEDFDIRAFHDELLGAGALPLSVVEARIHEWVEAQRRPREAGR